MSESQPGGTGRGERSPHDNPMMWVVSGVGTLGLFGLLFAEASRRPDMLTGPERVIVLLAFGGVTLFFLVQAARAWRS